MLFPQLGVWARRAGVALLCSYREQRTRALTAPASVRLAVACLYLTHFELHWGLHSVAERWGSEAGSFASAHCGTFSTV